MAREIQSGSLLDFIEVKEEMNDQEIKLFLTELSKFDERIDVIRNDEIFPIEEIPSVANYLTRQSRRKKGFFIFICLLLYLFFKN